jgi:anti-sigma factor RsiW
MNNTGSGLSEREIAELAALADGSLPVERRAEVEARIAASPELLELVERQRKAVAATKALSGDAPSASLAETVEALRSRRARRPRAPRVLPRLALAGGFAAVAAAVAAVVLTGGPGGPTVADAARLASRPPNAAAPPPLGNDPARLAVDVQGVAFPNLARLAGWQAAGVRRGHVDGRSATVVFYERGGRRIAYVIVAGAGLPRPSGQKLANRGVEYQTLELRGRLAVTWRRGGHTCVLIGEATRSELLRLASWLSSPPR